MKFSTVAAGAMLAGSALAHPAPVPVEKLSERQMANIDVTVLQFALTLEHLENVFYHGALNNFTQQDFMDAGYSASYYNDIKYISFDEQSHVQLLTSAIAAAGYPPTAACTYSFPYTDVASFVTLSSVLEGVGTSAYLGGAPLITSKAYLTVAGSILVTEALHTSLQRAAKGEVPMANPYGTPLDPTSVYTLAAMFILSCPASNPVLPFKPFPTLTYNSNGCTCEEPECSPSEVIKRDGGGGGYGKPANYCAPPSAGATIDFTTASAVPAGSYVTFVSGLTVTSVKASGSGKDVKVAIPAGVSGQVYAFVTSSDVEGTFSDSAVLFGPAVVEVNPPAPVINNAIV